MVLRNSAAAFTNVASVDGDQTDPTPGNNGGSAGTPGGVTETCGNCLDDDGDGLVDYEDPDCCAQTALNVTSATVQPKTPRSGKLEVKGTFTDGAFDRVDPRQEGMTVQIRNAHDNTLPQPKNRRPHRNLLDLTQRMDTSTQLRDLVFPETCCMIRHDGSFPRVESGNPILS